jgi:hypothetical protein
MTRQYDNYADLITFSRSSGGTALRPISYGTELVTNGTFDTDISGWTAIRDAIISFNANRLEVVMGPTAYPVAQQNISAGITEGRVYKLEATLTAPASRGARIFIGNSTASTAYTDILRASAGTTETVSTVFTATSDIANSGWINVGVDIGGVTGDTAYFDNISVKEVFFDQPNAPLTLFNHPAGIPRIEYDADGNRLGLLIEESRTNLLTYSEDFDNAAWIISNNGTGSVTKSTANAAASPDGTLTADRIIFDLNGGETTGDLALLRQANSTTGSLTHSVYLRSFDGVSSYTMQLILPDGNGENITVTGSWQRFEVSATAAGNVNYGVRLRGGQLPANSDYADVLIWGAQLEAGAFPTSYIPTSGATATRAADVASIPVSAFGYNQSEGTLFVGFDRLYTGANGQTVFTLSDGSASNYIRLYAISSSQDGVFATFNGAGQASAVVGTMSSDLKSIAIGAERNNISGVENGGSIAFTDTSFEMPLGVTTLGIGLSFGGSSQLNGHIKSIKYFPRRLTNAQLQELTT